MDINKTKLKVKNRKPIKAITYINIGYSIATISFAVDIYKEYGITGGLGVIGMSFLMYGLSKLILQ